jgi:hypothetical protein
MAIIDTFAASQGGAIYDNLARTFGITPQDAAAVVAAVIPALGERIERNTLSRGGLADFIAVLGQGHHQALLDDPALLTRPEVIAEGNAVLDQILWSKDASRALADRAALSSGVSSSIIRMMLPVIANLLIGALSKGLSGGLGEILGRMGQPAPRPAGRGRADPEASGMPRMPEMPGGGGLGLPMPDAEPRSRPSGAPGEVRMNPGGGLQMPDGLPDYRNGGSFPQPRSGADNPYRDLSDILRRGRGLPGGGSGGGLPIPTPRSPAPTGGGTGFPLPLPEGQIGGSMLGRLIRDLIGSAFGYRSKGVLSWIIQMIVLRYGWRILRAIFGGVLRRG